jgi:hypothetical protein
MGCGRPVLAGWKLFRAIGCDFDLPDRKRVGRWTLYRGECSSKRSRVVNEGVGPGGGDQIASLKGFALRGQCSEGNSAVFDSAWTDGSGGAAEYLSGRF